MEVDILIEKEQFIERLRADRDRCKRNLEEASTSDDWKLLAIVMVITILAASRMARLFEGRAGIAAFIATFLLLNGGFGYFFTKTREKRFRAELREAERRLEDARIEYTRIKRRVEV